MYHVTIIKKNLNVNLAVTQNVQSPAEDSAIKCQSNVELEY